MFHGWVSSNSVLLLLLVNFESRYRLELMYIYLHCKYQVKSHSSAWFSADFTTSTAHRNHFLFCFCDFELSYIRAELLNMCVKKSCFSDCWKVLSADTVFWNVGERYIAKSYCPVSLLSLFS